MSTFDKHFFRWVAVMSLANATGEGFGYFCEKCGVTEYISLLSFLVFVLTLFVWNGVTPSSDAWGRKKGPTGDQGLREVRVMIIGLSIIGFTLAGLIVLCLILEQTI